MHHETLPSMCNKPLFHITVCVATSDSAILSNTCGLVVSGTASLRKMSRVQSSVRVVSGRGLTTVAPVHQ